MYTRNVGDVFYIDPTCGCDAYDVCVVSFTFNQLVTSHIHARGCRSGPCGLLVDIYSCFRSR